ncbi:aldo/keto reductase [Cellulomonas chitinilytica]|uniref:Aldo/keto reductase n=1 Tax=Cellulomonas chitinilytica TaxID=398759 RepID=A0A919U1D9_9CELL|nr:tyrosine-protein phosphatase [Cellulomonas chitinilytica]GIG21291.1 aldo/keto reductase [Cellulomonas chitinilytica]
MTAIPGDPVDVPDPHVVASVAVQNLRDLGGRPTGDGGSVARGVVFRSAELASDGVEDDPALAALGIRTVVDLRTEAEREARPDHVPAGADHRVLDVLADLPTAAATQAAALVSAPAGLAGALAGTDVAEQMRATYRRLVVGDAARAAYAALVRTVLDADRTPVLVHCTAGKDRTGWAATILLLAAGVDEDGATEEFLAVNPAVRAVFAPMLAHLDALGEDSSVLVPFLEVRPDYLRAALDEMRATYGDFPGYLRDGLGLSPVEVEGLHRTMRG